MQPISYLFFQNHTAEAFTFYAEVFGSEAPELMPARAQIPDAPEGSVMHGTVKIGEGWLYGADDIMGGDYDPMAGVSLSVTLPDKAEATRVFDALSADGEVRQPLIETFFAPAFGLCSDRFGVRWMILAQAEQN